MMPVVGLTGGIEQAVGVAEERDVFGVPHTYVAAIQRSCALPLMLPTIEDVAKHIDRIDALVLTGRPNVESCWYGVAEVHSKTEPSQRDAPELLILTAALRGRVVEVRGTPGDSDSRGELGGGLTH